MKGFIKLIIVIAVLGGIWFAWEQWKGNEAIQVDYQTEPLEKGDLMITIEATGVTEPDELVDVGAQVSGIIMEFGKDLNGKVVDYSSPVKAGQMLAEIDKLPVQLDVQRAEASKAQAIAGIARSKADIQQAKAKHQQARLDRERAEKLGPGDALSKSSYDQYIADEETARRQRSRGGSLPAGSGSLPETGGSRAEKGNAQPGIHHHQVPRGRRRGQTPGQHRPNSGFQHERLQPVLHRHRPFQAEKFGPL